MKSDNLYNDALMLHENNQGKISVNSKISVKSKADLSLAYSPGVAAPCLKISEDKENLYKYTSKGNLIAVVSDGSAVLGLGDIGADASLPVMEGKAILFKEFANVDAFPICINSNDVDVIVNTCKLIQTSFGGINLEDISAPRCFEVEERLIKELDIPVFHDDQHGTAIVTIAGIINSCKLTNRNITDIKVVMYGTGAAGVSIIKMLNRIGVSNIYCNNINGIVNDENIAKNDKYVQELYNKGCIRAANSIEEMFTNADVFIGVSAANIVTPELISVMNKDSIVFAMANPIPEIDPALAKEAGAFIVGTGRSDYPNQVNNVLAFPGIFRGVLDARIKVITEEIKISAAYAIANIIEDNELNSDYVIPSAFDARVVEAVSKAVKNA